MPNAKTQIHGNIFERLLGRIDAYQQRHRALGFCYAVMKKYGDDDGGHKAALITYYGFLSLFPLLLVATTAVNVLTQQHSELRSRLLADISSFLPTVSTQLQESIHSNRTGAALVVGLLFALYGARGIADAMRAALDHAWATPRARRSGFPKNALKSFSLLLGSGLGLVASTTLASYATAALGHAVILRVVPIAVNMGLLYLLFMYVFFIGTSRQHARKDIRLGAVMAAIGLTALQTVGGYLLTHQLHNLRGLYGQFALVLAILFWIYLQAQVFMYAIEINAVHAYKLWPRSLTAKPLTAADQKVYELYAQREAYRPKSEEQIAVTFARPTRL